MYRFKYILGGLLLIIIILLLIDIGTGIWYWNRLNLVFNSVEYNNIVTPTANIISFLVIFFALIVSIRQNKINFSLSIKPFFERRIEDLIAEAKKPILKDNISKKLFPNDTFNSINYIESIHKSLQLLCENEQFISDFNNFEETGRSFEIDYYERRNYFEIILYLSPFAMGVNTFMSAKSIIETLLLEIRNSRLMKEDKLFLERRIKTEILDSYLNFIETEIQYTLFHPKMLILFERQNPVTYKFFHETEFANLYNWIKINC